MPRSSRASILIPKLESISSFHVFPLLVLSGHAACQATIRVPQQSALTMTSELGG